MGLDSSRLNFEFPSFLFEFLESLGGSLRESALEATLNVLESIFTSFRSG